MGMSTDELSRKTQEHLGLARAILDGADTDGRDLTDAERKVTEGHIEQAKGFQAQYKQAKADGRTKAALRELGEHLGSRGTRPGGATAWKATGSTWATSVREKVFNPQTKALQSGTIGIPSPIVSGIIHLPEFPSRVLDVLVNRRQIGSTNTFSYLRQSVRTNNAAPVADSATKPTSVYTYVEVEDRVRVVAHLSEAIPERFLADDVQVQEFLESEMLSGLAHAVEAQVLSGAGTGENMTGLLATSGVLTQAFATDVPTTLRKARTALEIQGDSPTAFLMHPSDVESVDLTRASTGGPWLMSEPSRGPVFGNVPIVPTIAVTAGTAVLGDWAYLQLIVREDAQIAVDRSGTLFQKNQMQMRVEGRYGVAVLRPSAFVIADLTA